MKRLIALLFLLAPSVLTAGEYSYHSTNQYTTLTIVDGLDATTITSSVTVKGADGLGVDYGIVSATATIGGLEVTYGVSAATITTSSDLDVGGNVSVTGTVDPGAGMFFRDEYSCTMVQYSTGTDPVKYATSPVYGLPVMLDDEDQNANWVRFQCNVPVDVDASTAVYAKVYIRLGGADVSSHTYTLGFSTFGASDALPTVSQITTNQVTFYHEADASGAENDLEVVGPFVLTSWAAGMTANSEMLVDLARDGDDVSDVSTDDSYIVDLKLNVGRKVKYFLQ